MNIQTFEEMKENASNHGMTFFENKWGKIVVDGVETDDLEQAETVLAAFIKRRK